jgi:hypothetical protein
MRGIEAQWLEKKKELAEHAFLRSFIGLNQLIGVKERERKDPIGECIRAFWSVLLGGIKCERCGRRYDPAIPDDWSEFEAHHVYGRKKNKLRLTLPSKSVRRLENLFEYWIEANFRLVLLCGVCHKAVHPLGVLVWGDFCTRVWNNRSSVGLLK